MAEVMIDKEMSQDFHIARKILLDGRSLVIARKGKVLLEKTGVGIRPLLEVISESNGLLLNSVIADKVVGMAVAMIARDYGARAVYGDVMSWGAQRIFVDARITYSYGQLTDYIRNREGTGMCPVEEAAKRSFDVEDLLLNLRQFLGIRDR
jgi:hypothetical protein